MVACVSLSLCATGLAGFAIYRALSSGTGLSLQHGMSWSIAQEGYIGKDMYTINTRAGRLSAEKKLLGTIKPEPQARVFCQGFFQLINARATDLLYL